MKFHNSSFKYFFGKDTTSFWSQQKVVTFASRNNHIYPCGVIRWVLSVPQVPYKLPCRHQSSPRHLIKTLFFFMRSWKMTFEKTLNVTKYSLQSFLIQQKQNKRIIYLFKLTYVKYCPKLNPVVCLHSNTYHILMSDFIVLT